jgi:PcaR/PcaU/PobR family beta-ketoadipate pathway transcriptional regulator
MNGDDKTGSLAKGLAVLSAFGPENPTMGVAEITAHTGINRATVYRIVSMLTSLGFLEQFEGPNGRREYRPGLKVLSLGRAALESLELPDLALPYLEELQAQCGETVNMAVLDDTSIVYIVRLKTEIIVNIRLFVGSRLPVYCTSMGKAILAFLPENELSALLDRINLEKITKFTVDSRQRLLEELAKTRERGFSINDQELALGLRSVAAPVFYGDRVVAAVNIAVPVGRATYDRMYHTFGPAVKATADRISNTLGQLPSGVQHPAVQFEVS